MAINKTLQLKRQTGFATAAAAKTALEAAFASGTFAVGEPAIGILTNGEVVLGVCGSSTSGSVFYNAATVDAAIAAAKAELKGNPEYFETIEALEDAILEMSANTASYSISATTESLPANVAKRYNLTKTVGADTITIGENIDIPKDSSLANVYLGHVDDVLTNADAQGESADMEITDGTGAEALCFINQLSNSKYKLTCVNCEDFLQESEFKDGLQVVDHEVSVKLDATAGSDSAKFLYMKPGAGTDNGSIALSGITEAISAAVNGLDATESGSSTHVSVQVVEADGVITSVTVNENNIASNTDLETEIAARKAVDGQNGQTYAPNTSANYISGATSLNDADVKLDTQVKANADAIAALEDAKVSVVKGGTSESFLDITESADKTVYTVTVSGITAAISGAVETLDAAEVGGTGKYLTTISETNGIISATAADLNAAAVAATAITGDTTHAAVTGTTVEAQINSISETLKNQADAALTGVTSANNAIAVGTAANNSQELTFQLDTTTATNNITSDMLDVTSNGLRMKDTFDCGIWS